MHLIRELDRILRGEVTRIDNLRDGNVRIPIVGIIGAIFILGFIYGICMGSFSAINKPETFDWRMIVAPMIKVPLLFMLTLVVTFPSLYVFNALVGSRLSVASVLKLIIASLAVILMVLASFGPITAFFSFSTESYSFMIVLNVMLFAIAGILGLGFMLQTLHRLTIAPVLEELRRQQEAAPPPANVPCDEYGVQMHDEARLEHEASSSSSWGDRSALDHVRTHPMTRNVRSVFRVWIIVFGLVGAQMAWIMRPFVGTPSAPFTWFRDRQGNFFEGMWNNLMNLLS